MSSTMQENLKAFSQSPQPLSCFLRTSDEHTTSGLSQGLNDPDDQQPLLSVSWLQLAAKHWCA